MVRSENQEVEERNYEEGGGSGSEIEGMFEG